MSDETTDISNKEQMTVIVRWVTADFEVCEEFVGLYTVPSIDSNTIFTKIMDTLKFLNVSVNKLRGQCYDGASTMSGIKNGVAKQIMDLEPRALYTHCYGHSLNLAISDVVKQSKILQDALDTTNEITKHKALPSKRQYFSRLEGYNVSCRHQLTRNSGALSN